VNGKLIVKMDESRPEFYESDWTGINWHHRGPFFDITEDSVIMNNVRVDILKSEDSGWHMNLEKLSRGNSGSEAMNLASEINFNVNQNDSLLTLARGFSITPKQQFRNQQVLVVLKVPVGKRIFLSENLDEYHWFNMNRKWRNNGVSMDFDYSDDHDNGWDSGVEYMMTEHGLERTGKSIQKYDDDEEDGDKKAVPDSTRKKNDNPNGDYRYHKEKPVRSAENITYPAAKSEDRDPETSSALVLLTNLG
jgi:hypothetical protein